MEERVGLKEVLAALDEFARDQSEFGDRLSELEATLRSINGSLRSLEAVGNDTLARLATSWPPTRPRPRPQRLDHQGGAPTLVAPPHDTERVVADTPSHAATRA